MWSIPPSPFVPTCYYPPPVIACPPQSCKPSVPCNPPSRPCHPCCGGCCGPKQIVYIPIQQPKKKGKRVGAKKPSRPCPPPTLNDNQSEYNNCNFFMSQLPQELLKRFGRCDEEEDESEESEEESEDCTEDTDWDETCTGEDTAGATCEEEMCPPPPQCTTNPCFPGFPNPCFPCFPNPFEMMYGMCGCGGGNSNVDECGSESGNPNGRGEGPHEGQSHRESYGRAEGSYDGQSQSYRDPSGRGGPYDGQSQSYRDPSGRGGPYDGQSQSYRYPSGRGGPYDGQSQSYRDPSGRGGPYDGQSQSYRDPSGRGGPYNSQSYRDASRRGGPCNSQSYRDPSGRGGPYNNQSYRDASGRGGPYNGESNMDHYSRGPEDYNSQSYASNRFDRSTSNRVGPSIRDSEHTKNMSNAQGTQWTSATPSRTQTRKTNISVTTGMTPTHSQTYMDTMTNATTGMTPTHSQPNRSNTKISVTTGMTPYQSHSETALDSYQHPDKHSHKHHSQNMENEVCCDSDSGEMVPVYRTTTQTKVSIVERPNEPSEIFVEQTPVQVLSYEKVNTSRYSKDTGTTTTTVDRSCGSGSHKKKHKKKKKKFCYDPCAMPSCPSEPHTRRLPRHCSDKAMKHERRLSQIHEPDPEWCFELPPPCPVRETKASILRKRPPAKCKQHKQNVPRSHEYCTTNNNCPEVNKYPLMTYDMPPSNCTEEYNETQPSCGGTHHEGHHHSYQHHQHGCNKVETRGAKRRHHHC